MTERSVTHATFVIERSYPASPARVFNAFADPAIKRGWFAEGEGWEVETFEVDFQVGGREHSSFRFQGGPLITNDTVYQDIVPDQRIIIAYSMAVEGAAISSSLATMEFKPEGKGTRLVFTEQGAYLDGHDDVPGREHGTRELLEALGRALEREAANA
jgi:uncharacterized protein YndB with AHSA1/START domain